MKAFNNLTSSETHDLNLIALHDNAISFYGDSTTLYKLLIAHSRIQPVHIIINVPKYFSNRIYGFS